MELYQMKSYIEKTEEINPAWKLVDADGQTLGRMAVKIATILMGKDKPTYTPHVAGGDFVVVINAEKIKVSGNKAETKEYDSYTHFPGGRKIVSFADMMEKSPEKVVEMAVKRMLPKNKLANVMFTRLKVFKGPEHTHTAQQPIKIEI